MSSSVPLKKELIAEKFPREKTAPPNPEQVFPIKELLITLTLVLDSTKIAPPKAWIEDSSLPAELLKKVVSFTTKSTPSA